MPRHAPLPHHLYVHVDNAALGLTTGGTTPGVLHALYARPGQILLGHVLLRTGAHFSGVPLHHIYSRCQVTETREPGDLQPWGAMGEALEIVHFPYLEGLRVELFRRGWAGRATGLVVDWADGFSRYPEQHKPLSLIALDSGHYCVMPNNYLRWNEASFVQPETWPEAKGYRRGEGVWWVEG